MTVNTIGVVGAGMMGSEIALVMALAGKTVLLSDRDQPLLDGALAKLEAVLDKGIARGFYSVDDKDRALANLQHDPRPRRLRAPATWRSRQCSRTRR